MDPWIDGCFVDLPIDVYMCRWIAGSPERGLDGSMDRLANGTLVRSGVGSRDRWSDRWSDGAKDASMEASTARVYTMRPFRLYCSHLVAFWVLVSEPWGSSCEALGVILGAFGVYFGSPGGPLGGPPVLSCAFVEGSSSGPPWPFYELLIIISYSSLFIMYKYLLLFVINS